jgi:hypothetical protein
VNEPTSGRRAAPACLLHVLSREGTHYRATALERAVPRLFLSHRLDRQADPAISSLGSIWQHRHEGGSARGILHRCCGRPQAFGNEAVAEGA